MEQDTFNINIKGSGFNIATMLITGFMFGVSISNSVYFSRISDRPSEAVGRSSAQAMLGINIVLAILSGLIFLWASYKLLISNEDKYNTMIKYVDSAKENMRNIRKRAEMSMNELNFIDTSDDDFSRPSNMALGFSGSDMSDTDFSDFY